MTPDDCISLIRAELKQCAKRVAERYEYKEFPVTLYWDLHGQRAGVAIGADVIRFNLPLLSEQGEFDVKQIAAHELAHLVVHKNWLQEYSRWHRERASVFDTFDTMPDRPTPHGYEWQQVMLFLGYPPARCHAFDVKHHRARVHRKYNLYCDCGKLSVSFTVLNRWLNGSKYRCTICRTDLRRAP